MQERLIVAADELIAEAGDAGRLSLRAVASRCGIAATSVYLHFVDLDELKVAVAQRGFAGFADARDSAAKDVTSPAEALSVRCQAYVHYALAHPGRYRLMFGRELGPLATTGGPGNPAQAAFDSLVSSIAACVAEGLGSAEVRRLALLVWTGLHGQVVLRLDRPALPWPPADYGVMVGALNGSGDVTSWQRVGGVPGTPGALPLTTVFDLSVGPDGYLYAATHGRGIWKTSLSGL